MKGWASRSDEPAWCPAHLGSFYVIDGKRNFRCERPAGHEPPHKRWSAPIASEWTDLPGGGVHVIHGRTIP